MPNDTGAASREAGMVAATGSEYLLLGWIVSTFVWIKAALDFRCAIDERIKYLHKFLADLDAEIGI